MMKINKRAVITVVTVAPIVLLTLVFLYKDGDKTLATVVRSIKQGILLDKMAVVAKREYQNFLDKYVYADVETDDWEIESREVRDKLPEFKTIKAASTSELTQAKGLPAPTAYREWYRSHGDATSSRFSGLRQINSKNVAELEVAWTYRAGTGKNAVQSNPVIAEGLLYTATGGHDIVALNAATGIELWKFHPGFDFPAKRGLVWWPGNDNTEPRIYFPAGNRLYALDARTGQPSQGFSGGSVKIGFISKIAPAIAGDILVTASTKPAMHGFNVITGKHLWTTDLLEKDQPPGPGGRASKLSGGNPWGGMALDEARGIAYFSTGNPGPVLVGVERPGNNLHSTSIVATNIRNGEILWAFQEIPHNLWDLDIAAPPILTTIEREGRKIDVVSAVTKAGNTLLLNRVTGKLVYDFRMRRAPTSVLPGERTAPYQPDIELPEPFAKQAFKLSDVTNIGEANRQSVLELLKTKNFGFFVPHEEGVETVFFGLHGGAQWSGAAADPGTGIIYVASSHVPSMVTVVNVAGNDDNFGMPSTLGRRVFLDRCASCHGENRQGADGPSLAWLALRFSTKMVEAIVRNGIQAMPAVIEVDDADMAVLIEYLFTRDKVVRNKSYQSRRSGDFKFVKTEYKKLVDYEGYPGSKPPWGTLNAINLNTGRIVWRVPLGEYPELIARGISLTGTENYSGPLATAGGLVFASGTKDRMIRAFASDTGIELWRYELPFNGSAPPSTYEIDGRQYLVIPANGGGTLKLYDDSVATGDALVAFALPR